jgi:(R,R)-butanediol dehydrogenase/meso-butanediol dehydrogenase/diacetyl reductase
VQLGETVAVIGDGAVGLISCQVARAAGAGRVILLGHRPARLALGRQLGADAALDTNDPHWREALADLTEGLGPDVTVEGAGRADAIRDAISMTRKGGRVVLLAVLGTAVPIDVWQIVSGERTVTGSVQHHFDDDLPAAIGLVASGRVDVRPLITRRIPLERIVEDGFGALQPGGQDIKVLVSTDG